MSSSFDQLLSETLSAVRDRHVAEHRGAGPLVQEKIHAAAGRRRMTNRAGIVLASIAVIAGLVTLSSAIFNVVASRSGDARSDALMDPAGGPRDGEHRDQPFSQARIERENRETWAYVACMRERGWPLPDPTPWEGPEHPGLLDPPLSDPRDWDDPAAADQYYLDSNECGFPYMDKDDNLLPHP